MQTTIAKQAQAVSDIAKFVNGLEVVYNPTAEDKQAVLEAADTLFAIKNLNFKQVLKYLEHNPPSDPNKVAEWYNSIELIKLLIDSQ